MIPPSCAPQNSHYIITIVHFNFHFYCAAAHTGISTLFFIFFTTPSGLQVWSSAFLVYIDLAWRTFVGQSREGEKRRFFCFGRGHPTCLFWRGIFRITNTPKNEAFTRAFLQHKTKKYKDQWAGKTDLVYATERNGSGEKPIYY